MGLDLVFQVNCLCFDQTFKSNTEYKQTQGPPKLQPIDLLVNRLDITFVIYLVTETFLYIVQCHFYYFNNKAIFLD